MKKKAPRHMKKSNKTYQHCIDGYYVEEVLKIIPNDVHINGCTIRFGMPITRKKAPVPTKLKKLGVWRVNKIQEALEVEIVLDKTTKHAIKKSVDGVAKIVNIDPKKATFRYLKLGNGEGRGLFKLTTKEMAPKEEKDAVDLRRKAKVLGLETHDGKINSLLAALGTEKFQCDIQDIVERKVVLCRKI